MVNSTRAVAARLRPGQLIVLESTTYPGTTRDVVQPILEAGGLRAGQEFFLADHLVQGQKVLPGAAQLELARTAVQRSTSNAVDVRLENVVFMRPVVVGDKPESDEARVKTGARGRARAGRTARRAGTDGTRSV